MSITLAQIKKIHTLLPAEVKHDKAMKQNLIVQFTGDADKTSTKDLTKHQAKMLIESLDPNTTFKPRRWASFNKDNKQHKYILSLCHQIGWTKYNQKHQKMVVDLDRLKGWLQKYGYLHKPLRDYTPDELPKLINQLEKVLTSDYKK